jgi:hypothetical protein
MRYLGEIINMNADDIVILYNFSVRSFMRGSKSLNPEFTRHPKLLLEARSPPLGSEF